MHAPAALLQLLAPWKELYSNSKLVDTATVFVHLTALLFGGGTAIVADRATIKVRDFDGKAAGQALLELSATHRIVLIALSFSLLSGIGLATADLETFLASPVFAVKLSLVALLVINGAILTRTEGRLRGPGIDAARRWWLWGRLQFSARVSMALWVCTLLAGTVLVNMV